MGGLFISPSGRTRRMNATLVFAIGACLLPGLASAEEPTYGFECDTPPGHYSYWTHSISSSHMTVAGTVTVNEKREDPKWNPTIGVLLYPLNEPGRPFGLQIFELNAQKDVLFLRLTVPGSDDEAPFAMIPSDTKSIPFRLSIAADGTLEVTAAGKSTSRKLEGFRPKRLQLSCSTGDFEFLDIKVSERN
jgi:hypothetical protein